MSSSVRFGWKRKPAKGSSSTAAFGEDPEDEEEAHDPLPKLARLDLPKLEDPQTRFRRLRLEAVQLAEQDKFWQSVATFDQALDVDLSGRDGAVRQKNEVKEMKAQALMQVSLVVFII